MNKVDKMNDISIYQINTDNGDGADIVFDFKYRRIAVSTFPSSPAQHKPYSDRTQSCLEGRLIDMPTW